jgi:hypothetical protein
VPWDQLCDLNLHWREVRDWFQNQRRVYIHALYQAAFAMYEAQSDEEWDQAQEQLLEACQCTDTLSRQQQECFAKRKEKGRDRYYEEERARLPAKHREEDLTPVEETRAHQLAYDRLRSHGSVIQLPTVRNGWKYRS